MATTDLALLKSGRWVVGCDNTPELTAAHEKVTQGKLRFRFPPEPNGFLHIGHAKSMNLNFGSAKAYQGLCYLRYDDTNPEAEEELYTKAIEEMVRWMGWTPTEVRFSSDQFERLFEFAVQLIRKDKAYVDQSTPEEIKLQRELRQNSRWRDRPTAESERLFYHMREGRFAEGAATLRLKMDMTHDNPNMRDVIAYRVKYCPHHHTGDKWCIYPSYDYTHCIIDSLEHIDFSLCTLEFETRRESYYWLLAELDLWRPYVWEFSRLNVSGSLLSKRKINVLVRKGIVRGFDDPRLLTLAGMRRRGYTPQAINNFCERISVTRTMNVIQMSQLEAALREDLDQRSLRRMLVTNPLRVRLVDAPESIDIPCPNHPNNEALGTRAVKLTRDLIIDRSDFREVDDDKNFYGLAPGGRPVGLKYAGNITVVGMERNPSTGVVERVDCSYAHERNAKPKTNISWVSAGGPSVSIRTYTPLLTSDEAAIADNFMQFINKDSEKIYEGVVEPSVADFRVFDIFQGERFGYYVVDPDTTASHMVLNLTIPLKEEKGKVRS